MNNSIESVKKEITPHAHVAKLCRQHLKAQGIKGQVRSKSYSGGSSVTVRLIDQTPEVIDQLNKEFSKYEMGSFNGMEDIYEYSNSRDDVPQVKFLFVENDYSDEMKQKAWTFIQDRCAGAHQYSSLYQSVPSSARVFNEWASSFVYQVLNGYRSELANEFWSNLAAAA